jgi:nucleotide-binding universal stress UspA family protein
MKLIVAYDGSNASERALECAKKRCRLFSAKLYVARSLMGGDETPGEEIEKARQELDHVENVLQDEGVPYETHLLVRGLGPGEDIVQFAEEIKADEIIIGIHKRSKVGKLLFGSTAQQIILRAPCPVLSVQ